MLRDGSDRTKRENRVVRVAVRKEGGLITILDPGGEMMDEGGMMWRRKRENEEEVTDDKSGVLKYDLSLKMLFNKYGSRYRIRKDGKARWPPTIVNGKEGRVECFCTDLYPTTQSHKPS